MFILEKTSMWAFSELSFVTGKGYGQKYEHMRLLQGFPVGTHFFLSHHKLQSTSWVTQEWLVDYIPGTQQSIVLIYLCLFLICPLVSLHAVCMKACRALYC